MKGMELVLIHMLTHYKEAKVVAEYMEKFKLDKKNFDHLLMNRVISIMNAAR
jgi:hypothetical protein